jgi:triacylglycerol lipase
MRRLTTVLSSLAATAALVLAGPGAVASQLPVPYNFLPAAVLGGAPGSNAPGTNDWNCKPTAAHPYPVILVHGTLGNRATNWQTYGPLLKNNGYCVFALTYGATFPLPYPGAFGGMGSMVTSAQELATFVQRVLTATGAHKVDLVGHSQGTLMPDYYVKFLGGASKVSAYVSLAPLWHGTSLFPLQYMAPIFGADAAKLPICTACGQMGTGSAFLAHLGAGGFAVPGVRYVNIMTKYDELVKPYTSGIETGMTNLVVQHYCAFDFTEHFEIAADRNASILVLNALDPAHPRPLVCSVVLPWIGGF